MLDDNRSEPYRFKVVSRKRMGAGRKSGTPNKSFIGSTLSMLEEFYESVVQEIDEWRPPVPQRKALPESEPTTGLSL